MAAERSLYALDQISFVRRLFDGGVKSEMLAPDLRTAVDREARRRFKRLPFDWLTGSKAPGASVDRLDVAFARNREGQVMKALLPGDVEGELIVASFVCDGQVRTRLFVLQPTPDSWLVVDVVLAPEHGALLTRLEPDSEADTGLRSMVAKPVNGRAPHGPPRPESPP